MNVKALDALDTDHSLMFGLVGEHRRAGDIADGVNAGDIGLAEAIGDDAAAIGLNAKLFEPEILSVADDTNAEIIRSAVIVWRAPFSSSSVAVTLSAPFSTFVTLVEVWIFMPCFSKRLRRWRKSPHPRPA